MTVIEDIDRVRPLTQCAEDHCNKVVPQEEAYRSFDGEDYCTKLCAQLANIDRCGNNSD